MITSRNTRFAVVCALAALSACSESDNTVSPFAADPVEPIGVYISAFNSTDGPTLEWTHDDDEETGFVVEWWTGTGGTATVVGTPDAGARSFSHSGFAADAINNYRVRAKYGPNLTGFEGVLRMDPRLEGPENANISQLPGDSLAVSWNPADFTPFDGFRVRRLLGTADELSLESDRIVTVQSSLEVTWVDAPPDADAFDQRLRYLVETRTLEVFSPPSMAGELAWQYPTRPANVVIGGPNDADVRARHASMYDRTVFTYTEDTTPTVELADFDPSAGLQSTVVATAADGELRGAPLSPTSAMIAHRTASGAVTLSAVDRVFGEPLWTVDRSAAHVPEMGPAGANEAWVAYDDTVERVDGVNGAALETIALTPLVTGGRVLDLDTEHPAAAFILRTTEDGSSTPGLALQRFDLTAAGAVAYTRTLTVGHVPASLTTSTSAEWIAVNYDEDEDGTWRSLLYSTAGGTPQTATLAGRAIAFSPGDEHVVLVDDSGWPYAVRLDGSLAAEDIFGAADTRGGYVESDGALITFQAQGRVNRYDFERGWATPVDGLEPRRDLSGDVPTSMWVREGSRYAF